MLPNVGTSGSNFKKVLVPKRLEPMFPNLGRKGFHLEKLRVAKRWNPCFPILEPQVPMSRNCGFPRVGTLASQPWNHEFPFPGKAGLEKVGIYACG